MIIDTSAIIAVLRNEPEVRNLLRLMLRSETPLRISAANYVECGAVIDSVRDAVASRRLDEFLRRLNTIIEPVTVEHAEVARQAYRDFGKGSGHPAGLNFGDCFSYALAKATREPLLFIGADFSHTDVEAA